LQRKRVDHDRVSVAPGVWDSVVGHRESMCRKIAVFQSLTTPGGIRLPSYQGNTKSVRTSSFTCCSVISKNTCRVSPPVVLVAPALAPLIVLSTGSSATLWGAPAVMSAAGAAAGPCFVETTTQGKKLPRFRTQHVPK